MTLVILVVQMRRSTRAMEESNRLEIASAVDRHSDSISRWRGRLIEHEDLARIWEAASDGETLDPIDHVRFVNLWIDFVNTQRANFVRADTVGPDGIRRQAILGVAAMANLSPLMMEEWEASRPWVELGAPEFVKLVEEARVDLEGQSTPAYSVRRSRTTSAPSAEVSNSD